MPRLCHQRVESKWLVSAPPWTVKVRLVVNELVFNRLISVVFTPPRPFGEDKGRAMHKNHAIAM